MPHTTTWEDVQAELDALEVYSPLDEAKDRLQILIGSRQYTPEVVKYFIELVRGMQHEFAKMAQKTKGDAGRKQALRTVMQQAEAKFLQDQWKVENVTNAQNIFNFTLEVVKKEVEEHKPNINIPVVLPVMNQNEAKELDSGKITVEMPQTYLEDLKNFKALLRSNWLKNYSVTPEEWKPFDQAKENIRDLMIEMLERVRLNEGIHKKLIPYFISVHDLNKNRVLLKYLRTNGCFVINDVISMWHPVIQREYRTSLLDAFPSTLVFRISPLNQSNQALNIAQPLISFLEQFQDLEFFKRIDSDLDIKCKDISVSTELKQFIMHFTPSLIPPYDKVNSPLTESIIGKMSR